MGIISTIFFIFVYSGIHIAAAIAVGISHSLFTSEVKDGIGGTIGIFGIQIIDMAVVCHFFFIDRNLAICGFYRHFSCKDGVTIYRGIDGVGDAIIRNRHIAYGVRFVPTRHTDRNGTAYLGQVAACNIFHFFNRICGIRSRGTDVVIFHRCLNVIFHFVNRCSGPYTGIGIGVLGGHAACDLDILVVSHVAHGRLSTGQTISCHVRMDLAIYVVGRTGGPQVHRHATTAFSCFEPQRNTGCHLGAAVMGIVQNVCCSVFGCYGSIS